MVLHGFYLKKLISLTEYNIHTRKLRPYSSLHKNRNSQNWKIIFIMFQTFRGNYFHILLNFIHFYQITSNHMPLYRNICTDMFPIKVKHTLITTLKLHNFNREVVCFGSARNEIYCIIRMNNEFKTSKCFRSKLQK